MAKINQEEYEVLKALDDKWKYLARNNMYGAKLEAHTSRPYKMTDSHWSNGDMTLELLGGEHLFQFIQWEDESPYNIAELIEEYLYDNRPKLFIDGQEQSFEFIEESEETEVKNIEELKSWFEDEKLYVGEYVKRKIDQLDEPEVLSQEFIDEHKIRVDNWNEAVLIDDLKNLLVPKHEDIDKQKQDAYTDGFKEGERQTTEYFESITEEPSQEQVQKYLSEHRIEIVDKEPETVASVIADFYKSLERLIKVLNMEVEEMKEC